jgi:hypothetical protein
MITSNCSYDEQTPAIAEPWANMELPEDLTPSKVGFVELFRFRVQPSGRTGRASLIRMSSPPDQAPLFPRERRIWTLLIEFEDGDGDVLGFAYADPKRPDDLFVCRPSSQRVERLSRDAEPQATPIERLCSALDESHTSIESLGRSRGLVTKDKAYRLTHTTCSWNR